MSTERKTYTINGILDQIEYEFPEKWYLKIDDENRDSVNYWRRNIIKYDDTDCHYIYICYNGSGDSRSRNDTWGNMLPITTEQFKKHVLKEEYIPIKENLDYLIDFLNQYK